MAIASGNRVELQYVKETDYGVTPNTAGNSVRITSESLVPVIEYTQSEELRSDRARARGLQTRFGAEGDINFELSYGNLDDFLLGLTGQTEWPTMFIEDETTIAATATGYTDTADGFTIFSPGQWVMVSGFTNDNNNGLKRVVSVTDMGGTMTVTGKASTTAEAVGDSVTIRGHSVAGNGTTLTSFSVDKRFEDVDEYMAFVGMVPGTMSLSVSPGSIVTGSMSFLGSGVSLAQSANVTAGTASSSARVMNSISDAEVYSDGSLLGGVFNVELTLNSTLRELNEVGRKGAREIALGTVDATGSLEVYFENDTLFDKLIGDLPASLSFVFHQSQNNWYSIDIPQVIFTGGGVVVDGIDTDVFQRLDFSASALSDMDIYRITRGS